MDDKRRSELRAEVRQAVPESPGVYTWRGIDGQVLYVGKSRNLRKRMLSYLTSAAARPDARTRNLVFAIHCFEWQETPGELMALLVEDARIKQFEPRYNERQRDYRERMYLLLTDDPFPACLVTDGTAHRGGTLWGPFKDEYFCKDLKLILSEELRIRWCTDAAPHRRSARFDLGQCPGPCRGAVSRNAYAACARSVRTFLAGDASVVVAGLDTKMSEASANLDFERAALLRDRRDFCLRFATRQQFFREFREGAVAVSDRAAALTLRFEGGLLRAVERPGFKDIAVPEELARPLADDRVLLDRANIVYSWRNVAHAARARRRTSLTSE